MPTSALAIRNLVEIDPAPDAVSFALRTSAPSAIRWSVTRLGAYRSTAFAVSGIAGKHWPALALDLMDEHALAERAALFARQFDGARSLRVLHVVGPRCEDHLLESFRPDVIVHDGQQSLPLGYTPKMLTLGGARVDVGFADRQAEDAFDNIRTAFLARSQGWQATRELLIDARNLTVWDGCYKLEGDAANQWIWTGAARTARLLVPRIAGKRLRLTLFLFAMRTPLTPEGLTLSVDGKPVEVRHFQEWQKVEAEFDCDSTAPCLLASIHHGKLGSTEDGSRDLGIALHKVKLEAL